MSNGMPEDGLVESVLKAYQSAHTHRLFVSPPPLAAIAQKEGDKAMYADEKQAPPVANVAYRVREYTPDSGTVKWLSVFARKVDAIDAIDAARATRANDEALDASKGFYFPKTEREYYIETISTTVERL